MDELGAVLEIPNADIEWRPSTRLRVGSRATVGRDESNDISFSDMMLSSRHAEFQHRDGSYYIVDLNSTNGTYVDNERVHGDRILHTGNVITVGRISLVFREAELPSGPGETSHGAVVSSEIFDEETGRTAQRAVDVADLVREDRSLGVVCRATNALVAHHPLPDLYDKVLEAILDSIPAQRAVIMLLEGRPPVPTMKAIRTRGDADMGPIRFDIVKQALTGREAFLVRDVLEGTDSFDRSPLSADPIQSVMCAPLWSNSTGEGDGRALGLLYLDSQNDYPPLTDRDFHILIVLANLTATKIENARLVEENLEKKRIEEDMRLAAEIQADLLPSHPPAIEGFSVCGKTEPCRTVGGDYFDFEHDGQRLNLALADVSGKGTGAAMLMVALRATVRAHWRDGALTEATSRINQTFCQNIPWDKFATFFVARLDPISGRLEYVNAGHNRPLLIRSDGRWHRLEVGGTVLGVFPDATYHQETVVLQPGDCLLVFSDGISDAWRDQDEADRHLVDLIRARRRGDVAALRDEILEAADHANDDRTLVILERLAGDTQVASEPRLG